MNSKQMSSNSDDDSYEDYPINFPSNKEIQDSFFNNQYNSLVENPKSTLLKKHRIALDSECRNIQDQLRTKNINTCDDCLRSENGDFKIIIDNPLQLINTSHSSQIYDKKNIKSQIRIIIIAANNDYLYGDGIAKNIGGIPSQDILFNPEKSGPCHFADLSGYLEDEDRCIYTIRNLNSSIDGKYSGFIIRLVEDIIAGYPTPAIYQLTFKETFKNIIQIKLLSSEFPIPSRLNINGLKPTYFANILIPNLNINRTINLDKLSTDNDELLTLEIADKILDAVYDVKVSPFISKGLTTNLSLVHLFIDKQDICDIKMINDLKLLLTIKGDWTVYCNETLLVLLDSILSYFRIVITYNLQLKVTFNVDANITPPVGSPIYLDNTIVGYFLDSYSKNGENYLVVLSENIDAFNIGNRLNLGKINFVFQVADNILLGEGTHIVLEQIRQLRPKNIYKEFIPQIEGLYRLENFALQYPEDSILVTSKLRVLNILSNLKSTSQKEYKINGTLTKLTQNSNKLSFSTRDLPNSNDGYQIVNIISDQLNRGGFQNNRKAVSLSVIMSDFTDDGNLRVYIRDNYSLKKGQWLKIIYDNLPPKYLEIIDIELERDSLGQHGPTVILGVSNIEDNQEKGRENDISKISKLKVIRDETILERGTSYNNAKSFLSDSCLRGNKILALTSSSSDEFLADFIVKIGNDLDGRDRTSSELNIISQTREIDSDNENDTNLIMELRYPIVNSRLRGTEVKLLYPIFGLMYNLREGAREIDIISNYDLSCEQQIHACINWLSNYLVDLGHQTVFISEEPIIVEKIIKLRRDNYYRLELKYPLNNSYISKESYLVLFAEYKDDKLIGSEMTSLTYNNGEEWFTGFQISKSQEKDRQLPDKFTIYGMSGENIPVFGLSESDVATRGLERLDVASNMEHISDYLTSPDPTLCLKRVIDKPSFFDDNYLVTKGRFMGRGGQIRSVDESGDEDINLDLSFSNLLANCDGFNTASCQFSRNLLPEGLTSNINNITLVARPIEELGCQIKHSYNYFYLCSPQIKNIELTNGVISQYKALDGWSFLNNSNYENEELTMRRDSMENEKLLNNIFAKIQVYQESDSLEKDKLVNTFVDCPAEFLENPIRNLTDLKLVCLWPDGQLVDFNCQNHSMTIELVEKQDTLNNINPINGSIN